MMNSVGLNVFIAIVGISSGPTFIAGLKEAGFETIMVNCNPETVSTDPDTSDRLYFEPLTAEDVGEIARIEATSGA